MSDHLPVRKHRTEKCLKPDSETVGNWMARRISRPMALRVTRLIAPLGIPADLMTCFAWSVGLAAATAFAFGQPWGWLVGAILLQLWYLLDHVDGQLARLNETESLDGAGLDYLMHHSLGIAVPLGVGFGLQEAGPEGSSNVWVLPIAMAWALGVQLVVAVHDARYKAFIKRLKRLKGQLIVEGGSGARPTPTMGPPLRPDRLVAWSARKLCEQHVTMNLLSALAILAFCAPVWTSLVSLIYVIVMAIVAWSVALWSIGRSVVRRDAEAEFAAWYKTPEGKTLQKVDGWWVVNMTETETVEPRVKEYSCDGTLPGSVGTDQRLLLADPQKRCDRDEGRGSDLSQQNPTRSGPD